ALVRRRLRNVEDREQVFFGESRLARDRSSTLNRGQGSAELLRLLQKGIEFASKVILLNNARRGSCFWLCARRQRPCRRTTQNAEKFPPPHPRLRLRLSIVSAQWCPLIGLKSASLPQHEMRTDVRFGSQADICVAKAHVRSTPNSDRKSGLPQTVMSALPPKADMCAAKVDVC